MAVENVSVTVNRSRIATNLIQPGRRPPTRTLAENVFEVIAPDYSP